MCGIAGVCNFNGEAVTDALLRRMSDTMVHRGPDAEGQYADGAIGLANRRLAVIDLTSAGHQPIGNSRGDVVVVYNGEIYNFPQLRIELEALGFAFRSRTDTEVLLHAYEAWGADAVLRFNGHFAFAIYDRRAQKLILARDRFGTKPLYYALTSERLIFGSEIKAILVHPSVRTKVCVKALNEYFTFQNVFSDLTLFDGIRLLPPGRLMTVGAGGTVEYRTYWDYRFQPEPMAFDDAVEAVHHAFDGAVTRQLISDVPVATFLSGGVDSSLITAAASRKAGRLSTFTCGFDLSSASGLEIAFDERAQAEALANLFKTEHYEVVLHAGDMEVVLRNLVWHLEDLRVGQSYPNYYVARLCSKFAKVVLSGVGGDELFAGYPWRYEHAAADREAFYASYYSYWQRLVPDEAKGGFFNESTRRELGGASTFDVFRAILDGADMPAETAADRVNLALYFELKTFLHGLLVVDDRLTMAHSLEMRAPFLDNDLVELALRIPADLKLRSSNGGGPVGKAVLREAARRLIPQETSTRPKQGFSAPDASWFRGESIEYVRRLLLNPRARCYDFLDRDAIAAVIDEHCSGHVNRRLLIWSLLSFETWCQLFL